jgi:hypothetical protein
MSVFAFSGQDMKPDRAERMYTGLGQAVLTKRSDSGKEGVLPRIDRLRGVYSK